MLETREKLNTKSENRPPQLSDLLSQQNSFLHNSLAKLIKSKILILQKEIKTRYITLCKWNLKNSSYVDGLLLFLEEKSVYSQGGFK